MIVHSFIGRSSKVQFQASMNEEDTRKRVHQDDIDAAISSKRAALGGPSGPTPSYSSIAGVHGMEQPEELMFFKILVPQSITGLIIGRGGNIINGLNISCACKIRLSQNGEYFPCTTDRVLVLNGNREGIANAVRELVTRIAEAPDRRAPSAPALDMYGNPVQPVNRGPTGTYQIKVLIPKTSSAAMIGKGGSVIKHMAEISNCKIQLGDESDPFGTRERMVIINSTAVPSLVLGAQTIMAQLLDDPRIRTYANTTSSYGPAQPSHGADRGMPGMSMAMGMPGMGSMMPPMPNMMMPPGGPMGVPGPYGMPQHGPYGMNPYGGMMPSSMPMGGMGGMPVQHHPHAHAQPHAKQQPSTSPTTPASQPHTHTQPHTQPHPSSHPNPNPHPNPHPSPSPYGMMPQQYGAMRGPAPATAHPHPHPYAGYNYPGQPQV